MKRNLPRAMMKDNGSAIESGEFACGPVRPGFVHQTTPPGNACKGNREGLQEERSDGCGQGLSSYTTTLGSPARENRRCF